MLKCLPQWQHSSLLLAVLALVLCGDFLSLATFPVLALDLCLALRTAAFVVLAMLSVGVGWWLII
jgi:hypothetical protein